MNEIDGIDVWESPENNFWTEDFLDERAKFDNTLNGDREDQAVESRDVVFDWSSAGSLLDWKSSKYVGMYVELSDIKVVRKENLEGVLRQTQKDTDSVEDH